MRYFTEDHEWVEVNGNEATVGISEYAADELGEISFIELPEDANPEKIKATMADGVLTFRIAVRTPEEQGVRKIAIG